MDDETRAGRGEKRRDDLHRSLTTSQEISAAHHQPSSVSSNVDVGNDSRSQSQFSNDAKSSEMMHGRTAQRQNDAQMQKDLADKAIASQEMANHQQLQMAIQSQLAYHQLSNQAHYAIQQQQQHQQQIANQQMFNQQLRNAYADSQLLQQQQQQHYHGTQSSQGAASGMHSGISLMQQLTPQKVQEYEELKKKEYQVEQRKLHEAQSSAQEQQRLEYQQQKLQSLQMTDLDFHQKLAALQMSHHEAAYLQQSPQQQFLQQQHLELQKQQQQMQYHQQMQHYQQMQRQQQIQHHQQMQQQLHQSQLNAMSTQLGHGTDRQGSANQSDLFDSYNGQLRSQHE
ncbi:hypothetical protein FHG87_014261 [Trinorchestia longiramus]|nr:hypothetical protein FHG87_014261 [Trinorchestia longiramus]